MSHHPNIISPPGTTTADRTVGELVAEDYARAAVFTELGIDFCCGGGRSAARACAAAGVAPERLVDALSAVDARRDEGGASDPRTWPLGRLVEHIVDEHHTYVRRTLPVLDAWTQKVARVHGARHPELVEIRGLFEGLSGEMTRHLDDEEAVLFPRVAAIATSALPIRSATRPARTQVMAPQAMPTNAVRVARRAAPSGGMEWA